MLSLSIRASSNKYRLLSSLFSLSFARLRPCLLLAIASSVGSTSNLNRMASSTSDSTSCPSTSSSSEFVVGYVTISNSALAEELAGKLVNSSLVACVNIIPTIQSIYRWEGKLENDREALMIIKTQASKSGSVIDFVKANHPYKVPEVIFTPILAGNPDYLKWVSESVRSN